MRTILIKGATNRTVTTPYLSVCEFVTISDGMVEFFDINNRRIDSKSMVWLRANSALPNADRCFSNDDIIEDYLWRLCIPLVNTGSDLITEETAVSPPPCICSGYILLNFGCQCPHSKKS